MAVLVMGAKKENIFRVSPRWRAISLGKVMGKTVGHFWKHGQNTQN